MLDVDLARLDEPIFSLRVRCGRAIFASLDAALEKKARPLRRCPDVRLQLHDPRASASRFFATAHRNASKGSRRSARKNIRADLFDRKKHGRTNRLPPRARGKRKRTDLPGLPALRDGRSNEAARSSSA